MVKIVPDCLSISSKNLHKIYSCIASTQMQNLVSILLSENVKLETSTLVDIYGEEHISHECSKHSTRHSTGGLPPSSVLVTTSSLLSSSLALSFPLTPLCTLTLMTYVVFGCSPVTRCVLALVILLRLC